MSSEMISADKYMAALVTLAAIILVGIIIQILINTKLHRLVQRTHWKGDNVIVEGLRGRIILWSLIIGLYSALPMLHLPPDYHLIVEKILLVILIFSVTLAASSILSGFIRAYSTDAKGVIFTTSIFSIFSRIVVMSIGFMIILDSLKISITPILTALGVGGLAVALAMQDTLGNLFAGLSILFSGKIKVGDYIRLQSGEEGNIIDINWRNTTIRNPGDNFIVIPNSKLASSITTNFNLPETDMFITIPIGVAYDSDLEKVERITLEVAREITQKTEGGVADFEPSLRFHTFADHSIDLTVSLRIRDYTKQYLIKHEFIKQLHKRYKDEGIVIPFPVRRVEFAKGTKNPVKE